MGRPGFNSLVESNRKPKNTVLTASLLNTKRNDVIKKVASSLVVPLSKALYGIPLSICNRQVVR